MHDTFLNENLYNTILSLCEENKISKVNELCITVHTDSHISEESLREHFKDRNSNLVGDWTKILVQKKDIQRLTAVLEHIEGEKISG